MSIEKNKELYDKILESINNANIIEEENIQVEAFDGYCDIPLFGGGAQEIYEDELGSQFYYYDLTIGYAIYKCTGAFSYTGIPSFPDFISVRPYPYSSAWGVGYTGIEFYVAEGTQIDYEVYGTGDTSTTFTISGSCEDGCSDSFSFILYDVNDEGPVIVNKNISLSLCSGTWRPNVTGILITDADIYTANNREIYLYLDGEDVGYFSLNSYTITAPTSVLLSVDTRRVGYLDDGRLNARIIATSYDPVYRTSYSDTGIITVDLITPSTTVMNQYNMVTTIPQGLYSTPTNFITVAHRIARDDAKINETTDCARRCVISLTTPYAQTGLFYINSSYGNHRNDLSVMINYNLDSLTNGGRISGRTRLSFNSSNNPDGNVCCGNDYCCGVTSINTTDIIDIGPPLSPFVTGIGERIPFSGGVGNVEESYFEPLGSSKIIIAPQASGTPLSSNDDYFYIYTHGNSSYSGIKHPTATGLSEVVGSAQWSSLDNFVLCRYGSNPDTFFIYNLVSSSWSSVQPFGAGYDVIRIIKLERNDGLYFIVGDGEYGVYNALDFTFSEVEDITTRAIILPENIALIPDCRQKQCEWQVNDSKDMLVYTNKYHIFALNHHYTNNPSNNYPLILELSPQGHKLQHGIDVVGNSTYSTTYLHSYLNYRTDIATAADKMVISLSNTGTLQSEAFIRDNTTNQNFSLYSLGSERRRVTTLTNDQVLWASYSSSGQSVVVDPFLLTSFSFPAPLFASIDVAASCKNEFRTLMLDSSGTQGYILNDLDRTYETISFTGSLPMGKYHDIIVLEELLSSVKQSRNFYMMPTELYETGSPSGHLAVISTTTTGPTGVDITGPFTINETVLAFEPIQTTTSRTEIGRFTTSGSDDEFYGSVAVGFDISLGDADIFEVDIVGGNSGIIYVKEGVALDYETRSLYTGYITGIDPYVGGPPFIDSFILRVLNVDEKPTDITLETSSRELSIVGSTSVTTFLTNFTVTDNDIEGNNNVIQLVGPDAHIFSVVYSNATNSGQLWLKAGVNFDLAIQNEFNVTLLAAKAGEDFTASTDFRLIIIDNPPIAVVIAPSVTGITENYIIPSNLKLANFSLIDNDSSYGNYAVLTGPDSSFFSITYDVNTNVGELILNAGSRFDYETKSKITGTISAGNVPEVYSTSSSFVINVIDIYEPTGIRVTPEVVTVREDVNTTARSIKLADLTWSVSTITGPMVVYDVTYPDGGYRSALDLFTIVDNSTTSPEIHLKPFATLDYETKNVYYVWISGRPADSTTNLYGGQLTLLVQDVDEPPRITFSPSTLAIPETQDTSLGSFKVSDVFVLDEKLSTVSLSLTGADSGYFTLNVNTPLIDSSTSIDVADLYFKSGVVLNPTIKNTYTGTVLGIDANGLRGTGNFVLSLTDVTQCDLIIDTDISNTTCPGSSDGRIFVDVSYTGNSFEDITSCTTGSPLSIQWRNVPETALIGLGGTLVDNLSSGIYSGVIYGGNIPLTGISYTINSTSNLQLLQVIRNNPKCDTSGTLTIVWEGGVPPYSVIYGNSREFVASGSELRATLNVFEPTTEHPIVEDNVGCSSSGALISFDFLSSSFTYESQSPPIIYDDTLESFRCDVSHGPGPYQVNLYHTTTGEKGELAQSFDRFDTSLLNRIDKLNNIISDDSGNLSVRLNNPNPEIYYYDFQNKIYPGTYLFEFVNTDNCSFVSDPQILLNIEPMTAEIVVNNDNPVDRGFYNISQPILDTLFIPYNMLTSNNNLLVYLSSLTEKSDIEFEIGGSSYNRKILDGAISCETYSILNIKFLGINKTDWFYTVSIYKGFDLTDSEIDILNEKTYLVLPNNGDKINIVPELNNNINTIKLLKGSILTTDPNTFQYKNGMEIGLFNFDSDLGEFVSMDVIANVTNTSNLYDKYIPGNVFKIDFLNNPDVSKDLTTSDIESDNDEVFTCETNQPQILKNRNFLIALNSFGLFDNLYAKATDYFDHDGSISVIPNGAYAEYTIEYYYYDKESKCISGLSYNNETLLELNADNLIPGIYILKLRDIYGNKIQTINGTPYDSFYVASLDLILNELNTTAQLLNFEYGDVIINLVNLLTIPNPPVSIPGTAEPEIEVLPTPIPPVIITTQTYILSPNTDYQNSLIIQTNPGKIEYAVSGPYGYNKKFNDRSILVQLPPGVYNITGDADSLYRNYLYPQTQKINVTKNTNILVNLNFESYQNQVVIKDNCINLYQ